MINPFPSTMTPDPRLRSFRSRGASKRRKNSSPKNLRKNGSSNGMVCGPSRLLPLREVKIFTTAGLTALAISTKFRSAPPPAIEGCGAVATGTTGDSRTACPNGNHPRSAATTSPISIPAATSRPLIRIEEKRERPGFMGSCPITDHPRSIILKLFTPSAPALNEVLRESHVVPAADDERDALMDGARPDVQNPLGAGAGAPPRLLDDERQRGRFVHEPEFSFGLGCFRRVQVDAPTGEQPMHVSHQAAGVATRVRAAGGRIFLGQMVYKPLRPPWPLRIVPFIHAVHPAARRHLQPGHRQDELPDARIQRKLVDPLAVAVHEHG